MVCRECNEVSDLHTDVLDDVISRAQAETDFTIETEKIYFYGTCSNCNVAH